MLDNIFAIGMFVIVVVLLNKFIEPWLKIKKRVYTRHARRRRVAVVIVYILFEGLLGITGLPFVTNIYFRYLRMAIMVYMITY